MSLRNRLDLKGIGFLLILFLVNKILILAPAFWATKQHLTGMGVLDSLKFLLFDNFFKWDSGWYARIAEQGYDPKSSAFFPLYPFLIAMVRQLLDVTSAAAGVLISNAAFFLMLYVVYHLIRIDYGERDTRRILWLFCLYPTSYYFSAVYTESLYLLLMALTLYCIRIGNWAGAGISGFVTSITRNTGVFLTIPYALEYFKIRTWGDILPFLRRGFGNLGQANPGWKRWKGFLWVFVIPLSFFLYMGYLGCRFGDPFAFSHAQAQFGRGFLNPFATIVQGYQMLVNHLTAQPLNWLWMYFFTEFFFVTLTLVVLLVTVRKLRLSYWVIILYAFLIPLTAPATGRVVDYFVSYSRYSLVIFPLYLGIYELVKGNRLCYYATNLVFAVLLVILVYNWSLDRWVA